MIFLIILQNMIWLIHVRAYGHIGLLVLLGYLSAATIEVVRRSCSLVHLDVIKLDLAYVLICYVITIRFHLLSRSVIDLRFLSVSLSLQIDVWFCASSRENFWDLDDLGVAWELIWLGIIILINVVAIHIGRVIQSSKAISVLVGSNGCVGHKFIVSI